MKWKPKQVEETPFIPEYVSDEYFSTQSLKRAVWQYLIDHSKAVAEGTVRIYFYMSSEQEFWRRVKARDDMKFRRIDEVQFQNMLSNKQKNVKNAQELKNKYLDIITKKRLTQFKIDEVMKKGTFKERMILKISSKLAIFSQKLQDKVIHI